jgi:hypothetical protein
MENISSNKIESEIAELSQLIEAKKKQLEAQQGIVPEDREAISEVVKDHFGAPTMATPQTVTAATDDSTTQPIVSPAKNSQTSDNYLDSLPPEDVAAINAYISAIPEKGFKQTIEAVKAENPYLIDSLHDSLVTKLFDELKARGFLK